MIRLFLALCKYFQMTNKNDDYLTCQSYSENILLDKLPCAYPDCPSTGNYTSAGSYRRNLVCYTDGKVAEHAIPISRVECGSDRHTHALLPPVIVPRSPFSFHFVISLLYDFITHKYDNVASLCSHYDISISTLYRIRQRFIEDKKLMLGIMNDAITSAEAFLHDFLFGGMADADRELQAYFEMLGTSFLQARSRILQKQLVTDSKPAVPT